MQYKQVRVKKETYEKLAKIAGILQVRTGKFVSLSDAIEYLIEENKKIAKIKI